MLDLDKLPPTKRDGLPYTTRGLLFAQHIATDVDMVESPPDMVMGVVRRQIIAEFHLGRAAIEAENEVWQIAADQVARKASIEFRIPDDSEQIVDGLGLANEIIRLSLHLDQDTGPETTITEAVERFMVIADFAATSTPEQAAELVTLAELNAQAQGPAARMYPAAA